MIPNSLKAQLEKGAVVPFVGAGVSMSIAGRDGRRLFPNWRETLLKAAQKLEADGKPNEAALVKAQVDADRFVDAARDAHRHLGAGWYDLLKECFDHQIDQADIGTLGLARSVWGLGSRLIITTNYDRSLQWACPDKSDFRAWDIEATAEQVELIRDGTTTRPTVWHLHGHIDNSTDLIITPDGYQALYQNPTPNAALQTFRDILKIKTLVFIGFSMADADLVEQLVHHHATYKGAGSRHFILLKQSEIPLFDSRKIPITPVAFSDYDQLPALVAEMCAVTREANAAFIPDSRYIIDASAGIHLFGGRSDVYFRIYDQAIERTDKQMDIFSLKLGRFRDKWSERLMQIAQTAKIRIALLDPSFPFPDEGYSVASLREKEEKATRGVVRRDVHSWRTVLDDYHSRISSGKLTISPGAGIEVRLYNTLPTVNLFRVDGQFFVGPYLLDVEDAHTPTFLVQESTGKGSLGGDLFAAYARHFEAAWTATTTRDLGAVPTDEIDAWALGYSP